jgi:pimeloyl-ACP methyl ester carboxylesterase
VIHDSGHLIHLEQPEAVAAALEEVIARARDSIRR